LHASSQDLQYLLICIGLHMLQDVVHLSTMGLHLSSMQAGRGAGCTVRFNTLSAHDIWDQTSLQVNPRDSDSAPVFQLETAMGSAIECFESAGAIVVPRTRFAPVKTCNDLFVLRSDAYKVRIASLYGHIK
jgi:UTP--glucose-1-phosphate uridylyltransferase